MIESAKESDLAALEAGEEIPVVLFVVKPNEAFAGKTKQDFLESRRPQAVVAPGSLAWTIGSIELCVLARFVRRSLVITPLTDSGDDIAHDPESKNSSQQEHASLEVTGPPCSVHTDKTCLGIKSRRLLLLYYSPAFGLNKTQLRGPDVNWKWAAHTKILEVCPEWGRKRRCVTC